jgi:hypothetical protein
MSDENKNQTNQYPEEPKHEIPTGPGSRYQSGPHEPSHPTFTPPWTVNNEPVRPPVEILTPQDQMRGTSSTGVGWTDSGMPLGGIEGESLVSEHAQGYQTLPPPLRFVFGDMVGVVFWVWIPVLFAFFLPWDRWIITPSLPEGLTAGKLALALVIAVPPWIVLTRHLMRGHIWDGILDMFLWAIWESMAVITLSYLYPGHAQQVIWNAPSYWTDMHGWIQSGQGTEGNPSLWIPLHLKHLIMLLIGAFLFGLPALVMGVLQLNYMNYYVAKLMLASTEPLVVLPVAWHFWSALRVSGYIIIACAIYQIELFGFNLRRSESVKVGVISALVIGFILVIMDAMFKWQFAETTRQILERLTNL